MKLIALISLLLFSLAANAQKRRVPREKETDSIAYYSIQLSQLQRQTWDSIRKSAAYISLQENIERLRRKQQGYEAFIVGGEIMHSNYTAFNKSIVQSGFAPLKPIALH